MQQAEEKKKSKLIFPHMQSIKLYLALMENYSDSKKIRAKDGAPNTESTLAFQIKLTFDFLSVCVCVCVFGYLRVCM